MPPILFAVIRDIRAVNDDLTFCRGDIAGNQVQQRRFSGTAPSDNAGDFAFFDGKRDIL